GEQRGGEDVVDGPASQALRGVDALGLALVVEAQVGLRQSGLGGRGLRALGSRGTGPVLEVLLQARVAEAEDVLVGVVVPTPVAVPIAFELVIGSGAAVARHAVGFPL